MYVDILLLLMKSLCISHTFMNFFFFASVDLFLHKINLVNFAEIKIFGIHQIKD